MCLLPRTSSAKTFGSYSAAISTAVIARPATTDSLMPASSSGFSTCDHSSRNQVGTPSQGDQDAIFSPERARYNAEWLSASCQSVKDREIAKRLAHP